MQNVSEVSWKKYINKSKGRGPHTLLVEAMKHVPDFGNALDLGAGAMNDTRYLLNSGFVNVTAVDYDETAALCANEIGLEGFFFFKQRYEDFHFAQNTYQLVNAAYTLPLLSPSIFALVWPKILASLRPQGIFVGQLFGDRDTWNVPDSGNTFHTKSEARSLFEGMELITFLEEEDDRKSMLGKMKHFHIFHYVARKV